MGTRVRKGRGDALRDDFGTRRRAGIRGRDKEIIPDFCAELVKYFFCGSNVLIWLTGLRGSASFNATIFNH